MTQNIPYADDTVIYNHGRNAEQVAAKLSQAMEKVENWLKYSCFTLLVIMYSLISTNNIYKINDYLYLLHSVGCNDEIKCVCMFASMIEFSIYYILNLYWY